MDKKFKITIAAAALCLLTAFTAAAEPLFAVGGVPSNAVLSDAPQTVPATPEGHLLAFLNGEEGGPGVSDSGAPISGGSGMQTNAPAETGTLELSGQFVKPSYWRGDVYCAESCVSDGNGGWIYNYTDSYNPTQDALYRVIREDGDWYVVQNFGQEMWLKKEHVSLVTSLPVETGNETRKQILQNAFAQLGKPYRYGAGGPDAFDCSGFVNYCYTNAGITVPRTSGDFQAMANISADQVKPGDILWRPGHVGMYVGNGTYIHSEQTGTGVRLSAYSSDEFQAFVNVLGD